jgi:hypothetical protein
MDMINQGEKTLVFCASQLHALAVRDLINQIETNKDPLYCVRVTAGDGKLGDQYLLKFRDNDKTIPTILTSSQKLSTGVDARGAQLAEISSAISAEKSDIFDVLAYVAFARPPITRRERADASRDAIAANYDDKLQIFLDFVLSQYVSQGVEELDQEKLGALVALKYGSAHEAEAALGSVGAIRDSFVGFQRYLYET